MDILTLSYKAREILNACHFIYGDRWENLHKKIVEEKLKPHKLEHKTTSLLASAIRLSSEQTDERVQLVLLGSALEMQISHKQFQTIKRKGRLSNKDIERLEKGLDPIPLEEQEGERLAWYLRMRTLNESNWNTPGVIAFTHIGNETGQSGTANILAMMKKKKRQGLNPGFPDYFICVRTYTGGFRSLAIELKRLEGSRVTKEQKEWINWLKLTGVEATVAKGADEAIAWLETFIGKV